MSLSFPGRSKSLVELVQAQREQERIDNLSVANIPIVNGIPRGRQPPRGETFTCPACGKEQPQCRTGHPKKYCDKACRKALELRERRAMHEGVRTGRREAIIRSHQRGTNAADIARAVGMSHSAVMAILRSAGLSGTGARR